MQNIYILFFIILWSSLAIQAQDSEYVEANMFNNTVKYKAVKASANKSPHLKIRIDKALAENKLFVEQIGFRYSYSGVEFAVFFKQPIPNLQTKLALVVYDKSGKFVFARGFQHNANEYKKEPQVAYLDYLAPEGDVVILRLMEATKIPPATSFDLFKSNGNYKWATATLPDDVIPPPPMEVMVDVAAEEKPYEAPKFELPKNLKKNKAHCFRAQDTQLYGYFRNDTILVPFEYEELDNKYSDFMIGKKKGMKGAINGKGEVIIPFKYQFLNHTSNGFVLARKKWQEIGLLNRKNELLVPMEYQEVFAFSDSVFIFVKENQQLVLELKKDQSIRELKRFAYEGMGLMEGYTKFIWAKSNGKQGIITLDNNILLPFEYKRINWVKNNLVCFEGENNRKGIVNFQQKQLIAAEKFIEIHATSNPNMLFVSDEKYKRGAVDTSGKQIVPNQYYTVWDLDTSSFLKGKYYNGKWALWNTAGKQLSSEMYEEIYYHCDLPNLLFVQHPDKRWQFLNRKGEALSAELYNEYYTFKGGMTVTLNNRLAVFNKEGKQLTGFDYEGFAMAFKGDEAEAKRKQFGLPDGVKLLCIMYKPGSEMVAVDETGKEYAWKK